MDEVTDCSTDGTCEEGDSGPSESVGSGDLHDQENATLIVQTTRALQQLSIIIGVAMLVALLFFLMIAVDKVTEWAGEKWSKMSGKEKEEDPEDPAALVGSFKRYK